MTPEEQARQEINRLLTAAGWVAQNYRERNLTANVAHLGSDRIPKMAFPFPPFAEQTRIVAEVERRLSVIEELEAVVSTNLQRAGRLLQAVLQQASSGDIA